MHFFERFYFFLEATIRFLVLPIFRCYPSSRIIYFFGLILFMSPRYATTIADYLLVCFAFDIQDIANLKCSLLKYQIRTILDKKRS